MTVSSTTTYRAQLVTEIQIQQIIVASGDDASAARALRVLMMQSQLTGAAEMQALDFISRYGSDACGCEPTGPLSRSQALSICRDNFNLLDTAAGIGDRDGIVGRADLQAILDAPDASPRLKAAARYLLDHFSELDDAAGNLGREDGKISMQDLDTGIAGCQMNDSRAIEIMRGNFDKLDTAGHGGFQDGLVSRDDLEGVLRDPSASPELKAAARYALAHPELFDRIDTAGHGGDRDGLVSRDDLDVSRESIGLDGATAGSTVLNFFGTVDDAAGNLGFNDNLIARCDLEAIVENDSAPADVKAAARYLLDHPEVFDQIDTAWKGGSKDGLISPEDLRTWLGGADPAGLCAPDPIDVLRANFGRLDTAAKGGLPDGLVSREDLEAALNDPNTSEQLRSAIRFALDNQIFDQLDTAGYGGDRDGRVSMDDLEVAREMYYMDDVSALQAVQDNFGAFDTAAHGGSPDGLVSRSDLEAVLRDPDASPQQKAAAHYLLENPEAFDQIDTAAYGGSKDGLISQDDLRAYMRTHVLPTIDLVPLPQTGSPADQDPFGDPFQNEIEEVLTDPTLSVEDQVTLFIMLVMKKMDKQIEEQMHYINQLQQQQNKAGQNGQNGTADPSGRPPQSGPSGKDTSIDVETLKLKRLVDKRSQMFDMLRQIIDKYNQTAKGIIDTMGR